MSEMSVEVALERADIVADLCRKIPNEPPSEVERTLFVLAAEVRRLRTAVEAVRALPSYDHMDTYMAMRRDGDWIDRAHVLAALEATDGT